MTMRDGRDGVLGSGGASKNIVTIDTHRHAKVPAMFISHQQAAISRLSIIHKEEIIMMSTKEKLVSEIIAMVEQLADSQEIPIQSEDVVIELLTIKECTELIRGLSVHTVRQLFHQRNDLGYQFFFRVHHNNFPPYE